MYPESFPTPTLTTNQCTIPALDLPLPDIKISDIEIPTTETPDELDMLTKGHERTCWLPDEEFLAARWESDATTPKVNSSFRSLQPEPYGSRV